MQRVFTEPRTGARGPLGAQASCLLGPFPRSIVRRYKQAGCLRPQCRQDACAPGGVCAPSESRSKRATAYFAWSLYIFSLFGSLRPERPTHISPGWSVLCATLGTMCWRQ
jgi:hypothetical protein